jgi:hypothetical protein
MKYDKAVQLQLFYSDEESGLLPTDQETISKAIEQSLKDKDTAGKFVPGNTMRFQTSQPQQNEPEEESEEEEAKEEELNNKF